MKAYVKENFLGMFRTYGQKLSSVFVFFILYALVAVWADYYMEVAFGMKTGESLSIFPVEGGWIVGAVAGLFFLAAVIILAANLLNLGLGNNFKDKFVFSSFFEETKRFVKENFKSLLLNLLIVFIIFFGSNYGISVIVEDWPMIFQSAAFNVVDGLFIFPWLVFYLTSFYLKTKENS